MNINFTNINFEKDIYLPENIQSLNNDEVNSEKKDKKKKRFFFF